MSDMKLLASTIIGVVLLVGGVWFVERGADSAACYFLETQIERPTKFHVINGCFVRVRKQWVPERNWRETENGE